MTNCDSYNIIDILSEKKINNLGLKVVLVNPENDVIANRNKSIKYKDSDTYKLNQNFKSLQTIYPYMNFNRSQEKIKHFKNMLNNLESYIICSDDTTKKYLIVMLEKYINKYRIQ